MFAVLSVIWLSLRVVRCSLFVLCVVCCLLLCCWLSVGCCVLFDVWCLLCVVCVFVVRCLLLVGCCSLITGCCLRFARRSLFVVVRYRVLLCVATCCCMLFVVYRGLSRVVLAFGVCCSLCVVR